MPLPGLPQGLTPWEYTIAQLLHDSGYSTAMYGKSHLGDVEGRYPNDQGFDEWMGIASVDYITKHAHDGKPFLRDRATARKAWRSLSLHRIQCESCGLEVSAEININAILHPEDPARNCR